MAFNDEYQSQRLQGALLLAALVDYLNHLLFLAAIIKAELSSDIQRTFASKLLSALLNSREYCSSYRWSSSCAHFQNCFLSHQYRPKFITKSGHADLSHNSNEKSKHQVTALLHKIPNQ